MKTSARFELPEYRVRDMQRAVRIEWISVGYLIVVNVLMFLVMGNSQAMKSEWTEQMLALVPPVGFLIAARIRNWSPNERYPYGYYRSINIAFLFAAGAIFTMGVYLLTNAATKLITAERPSIGTVQIFGHTLWLGWLMLLVLSGACVPMVILGRIKLKLARSLHDKPLYADAVMSKADWLTAMAAIVGVVGIGIGWWWTDAVAAGVISLDVLKDGFQNLRAVIGDFMDRAPETVDREKRSPVMEELTTALERLSWVNHADVRLREHGHVYFGEVDLVVNDDTDLLIHVGEANDVIRATDWRLHDVAVQIVHLERPES